MSTNYERFTDRARKVMRLANQEAQRLNFDYIDPEHILLGIVKEGSGVALKVMEGLDIDPRRLSLAIESKMKSMPDCVTMGKLPLSDAAKGVVNGAVAESRELGHNYVGTEHLLIAILARNEWPVCEAFRELGVDREVVRTAILRLLGHEPKLESTSLDYNVPPLAAVTGVVRLRNGETPCVRVVGLHGSLGEVRDAKSCLSARVWSRNGCHHSSEGRHPADIVEQVSVGPTGPGVYETDIAPVHVGGDQRSGGVRWDEFGRARNECGARCEAYDLRRRIGDLPEAVGFAGTNRHDQWICAGCGELGPGMDGAWRWTSSAWEHACEGRDPQAGHSECELLENVLRSGKDPLPAEVQEHVTAVEKAGEAAKAAEQYRDACERLLGVARQAMCEDAAMRCAKDDLPHLLVALAAAAGKRDAPEPVAASDPAAAPASCTAEDAMAALYRPWTTPEAREMLLIDVRRAVRDRVDLRLDPDHHLPHVEAGLSLLVESRWGDTSIDREHLRVLFRRAESLAWLDFESDERRFPFESEYRAMKAAADVLGETLPGWILEHAKKEGWA